MRDLKMKDSKGQVSVFIILALVIVTGIVLFFIFRASFSFANVPAELEPVYNYYLSCIENEVSNGARILGEQGGYIESPDFSPGSEYMPFSSHLGFMGLGIPYWYYVSGNGIKKEQIPSEGKMESQLEDFVEGGVVLCDFSYFEKNGFEVELDNEKVGVDIEIDKDKINFEVKQRIKISFGESSWTGESHSDNVQSSIGKFYDLAKKIYLNNKDEMFLENYGVDILRLYAPVDGTEISCVPKIWEVDGVRRGMIDALEANVPAIKIKGDYYDLKSSENKYFVRDIGEDVDTNVNFMYSPNWPMKMEVWPSDGGIIRADPIGNQEGLEMMGFCYAPYHFVYDFAFPVLVQLYSGNEMFQFPVVVMIDKNKPREALDVEGLPDVIPELCEHKNSEFDVYTYNSNLEPVEARIKFKCFDSSCEIGESKIVGDNAILTEKFPQCVNGYLIASAEGYKTEKYLMDSVEGGVVDIVLDKEYELDLEMNIGSNSRAIVTFDGESKVTLAYPEQKKIKLSGGQYEVQVYVYSDVNMKLEGDSSLKCVDVPKSGVAGVFGFTEEKCFNMEVPEQNIESGISGGGTNNYYVSESELSGSNKLILSVDDFGIPSKVEDLQGNYQRVKDGNVGVAFG
ncbi:hypothetical protein HOE04_02350 [archaeon]|jgi:hypothetical protein|nr:hypothetical protein [archaeon]